MNYLLRRSTAWRTCEEQAVQSGWGAIAALCDATEDAAPDGVTANRLGDWKSIGNEAPMHDDPAHRWQHPWLRVGRLIREILGTRWSADVWPKAKAVLGWALAEQGRLRRSPWWN